MDEQERTQMMPTGHSQRLRGRRILIVEDQSLVALDLALIVEDEGGQVEGPLLRVEDAFSYDLIDSLDAAILDIDLCGREVFPVAERLVSANVPIVFHTARADVDQMLREYPASRILRKPSAAPEIVAALEGSIAPTPARAVAAP